MPVANRSFQSRLGFGVAKASTISCLKLSGFVFVGTYALHSQYRRQFRRAARVSKGRLFHDLMVAVGFGIAETSTP